MVPTTSLLLRALLSFLLTAYCAFARKARSPRDTQNSARYDPCPPSPTCTCLSPSPSSAQPAPAIVPPPAPPPPPPPQAPATTSSAATARSSAANCSIRTSNCASAAFPIRAYANKLVEVIRNTNGQGVVGNTHLDASFDVQALLRHRRRLALQFRPRRPVIHRLSHGLELLAVLAHLFLLPQQHPQHEHFVPHPRNLRRHLTTQTIASHQN